MLPEVKTGQKWSTWVPGRQQWLLATVIRHRDGMVTLKYDMRYGIRSGEEQQTYEDSMLTNRNLFRFVEH
jgi:hypothetical protein